jgi:hypothetical protein
VRLVEDGEDGQHQSGHGAAGGQHRDDRGADDDDEAA